MTKLPAFIFCAGALCALCVTGAVSAASPHRQSFTFAVIGQSGSEGISTATLSEAIAETQSEPLRFILVNGVKSADEACDDELYNERRNILDDARHSMMVSLAASDWAECRREDGSDTAMDRLTRLRELFFSSPYSAGHTRAALTRQSMRAQFRSYAENAHWEIDSVLFATVNLPADNNHFSRAAGRNSEFEDRMIANRAWLKILGQTATRKKHRAIVLFCDGDPTVFAANGGRIRADGKRDGFFEFRRQLRDLAASYRGRVLLVHNQADPTSTPGLQWRGNLGELVLHEGMMRVRFDSSRTQFSRLPPGRPR